MNIEEIKVRLSNLDEGKIVKFDYAINLATQALWDYKHDITYLLSIIEQDKAEILRITGLLNELTACCEYMNIINGRCISCETVRGGD